MEKIRILLADDHTILRSGIRSLLEDEPGLSVIGEAEDGRTAVSMACQLKPDVVIMDIAMPLLNGLEATRQIKAQCPAVRVLILTMHDNEEVYPPGAGGRRHGLYPEGCCRQGADQRHSLGAPRQIGALAGRNQAGDRGLPALGWCPPAANTDRLSPREREVLQLIAEGYTNKQMAEILSISIKTVQAHRNNLMQKLDLHDRGELIKYAIQKKIIEI